MYLQNLKNIERNNYLVGALYVLICLFVTDMPWWLGAAVGVALSCANFTVMRMLASKWGTSNAKSKAVAQLLMIPKMGVIMVLIYLAATFLPISVIGLATGFGVFLVSIAIETVRSALAPETEDGN